MKKNILLYMAAVAGLVLAGCNKEGVLPQEGSLDMTVTANIGDLTKVTTSGVKTTFDNGDQLSLYAWIGEADKVSEALVVDGVVNTFDGKDWTPATQMLWKNAHDAHYFIGISPAHDVVSFIADPFVLNPAEYAANDLLIANELSGKTVTKDQAPNPVSLTFSHALAKLNVNLKFRSQWDATPEVTSVATTAMDCYKVNYLTKEVTAYGDNAQVQLQALDDHPQDYALSYSGLQVPQDAVTVITVVIDGKDYIYTAAEPIVLQRGKVTTLGLIVGREKITLGSVSVANWDEGTTYEEDGDAVIPDPIVLNLTTPKVGEVIGSDGKNYVFDDLPKGVTPKARICYVDGSNGLALAMRDEAQMNWETACSEEYGAASHTPVFIGGTWKLASQDEWNLMLNEAGPDALRTSFSGIGGQDLKAGSYGYWSSTVLITEGSPGCFFFKYNTWASEGENYIHCVRACLKF